MNDPSGTRLQLLFDAALQSYEKQTGLKLIDHPLAMKLEKCHTVDSVMDILQHQARAVTEFREDDGKIMGSLKRVVHVLHALSTSTTLGEGIGLVRLAQFSFQASDARSVGIPSCNANLRGIWHPTRCSSFPLPTRMYS